MTNANDDSVESVDEVVERRVRERLASERKAPPANSSVTHPYHAGGYGTEITDGWSLADQENARKGDDNS